MLLSKCKPCIVFLIYDSRSGSTLLAKEITHSIQNTFITQEIGFDSLLNISDKDFNTYLPAKIFNLITSNGQLRNSHISIEKLKKMIETSSTRKMLIENIINELIQEKNNIETIIIKNGSHIKYWNELYYIFGNELKFIYIYRDPRAVYASKVNAKRPYAPYETMAWGGPLITGLRWKRYSQHVIEAQKNNIKIITIKYEDFIENPEKNLTKIAKFLNQNINTSHNSINSYQIPVQEKGIHLLVDQKPKKERRNKWQDELTDEVKIAIELITHKEMILYGYDLSKNSNFLNKIIYISKQSLLSIYLLIKHYILLIIHKGQKQL